MTSISRSILVPVALLVLACPAAPDTNESSTGSEATTGDGDGDTGGMSTCPQDADLNLGPCPAQGETCTHFDFNCECLCNCGSPEPGQPGNWNCDYARVDDLLQLTNAEVRLDCDAQTVSGTVASTLDNSDGQAALEFEASGFDGIQISLDGQTYTACGGLCGQGQTCPSYAPVAVGLGEVVPLELEFGPGSCAQVLDPPLCDYCGGQARLTLRGGLSSAGVLSGEDRTFDGIPIVCP